MSNRTKKRRRNEISHMADGTTMLDRTTRSKSTFSTNHKTNGESNMNKIPPYDTGKVKIGIYYEPKVNYYNHDQDWVQKVILGVETSWTTDIVVITAMYALLIYAFMGLMTRGFYE